MSIILGIDPGTTTTGFAVIKKTGRVIELLDYGIINTEPKISQEMKLYDIGNDIEELINKYKPDVCGIERLYFLKNVKTGIEVAQSRGVIIYQLTKVGIPIVEFTPLQVKSGICGNGGATKKQMQNAIKIILKLDKIPTPDDVADAIGIAYLSAFKSIKN